MEQQIEDVMRVGLCVLIGIAIIVYFWKMATGRNSRNGDDFPDLDY